MGPMDDRVKLDSITVSTEPDAPLPDDHELRSMSDTDVRLRLRTEIDKIRKASGVFRAYVIELRARG